MNQIIGLTVRGRWDNKTTIAQALLAFRKCRHEYQWTLNVDSHRSDGNGEHFVQFYENDAFLIDGITEYIGSALAAGDKGIVIATKRHLKALEDKLNQRGLLGWAQASEEIRYIPIEADKMLPLFMVNGMPDENRFTSVIGGIIVNAALGHQGRICVFGEMVAILCGEQYNALRSEGKHAAAIYVEKCFNKLLLHHRFSLLCGYPMDAFPREEDAKAFHEVCGLHTSVIPTEAYNASAGIDHIQRTIASLQQKAFSLVREVNERLLIEQALRDANFDKLTGLPNRSVLQDRLHMEIRKAHRDKHSLALLFIDLDHFKEINDTLGHHTGDVLLQQVAQRLAMAVRENDTVARLGGDEFTVILSELEDPAMAGQVAEHILQNLSESFRLGTDIAYVSASIGITLCPQDANNVDELLRYADQAMYAAKNMGRNCAAFFKRSMQEAAQKRRRLANELRDAITKRQLRLFYQPIVELPSCNIHKAEALLRWQHPVHGLIGPIEFIPVAEHTGMIIDIGEWVFYEAARHATRWRKLDPDFQISINVSPSQFQKRRNEQLKWTEHIIKGRDMRENTPSEISVEITEGLLLDASSAVINQLLALRDAGIQVSLDDFGTGYSSLSYLRKFDIDYLKIDQSFVLDLEENPNNLALCEAIIVMAHRLGLKVIAEGVETTQQRDRLQAAMCDFAQGYLFSRPVPAAQFETLLRSSGAHS
jgi:diguanylate cyclase (GGDEF)-like protein